MARGLKDGLLAEVTVQLGTTILDVRHIGCSDRHGHARGTSWSPWLPWLPRYIVGEGPLAHLPVALPGPATEHWTLVEATPGAIYVHLAPGMTGCWRRSSGETSVAELLAAGTARLAVQPGETVCIQIGAVACEIRVAAAEPIARYRGSIDRPVWAIQGSALALFAVLMVVLGQHTIHESVPDFSDPEIQARLRGYFGPPPTSPTSPQASTTPAPRLATSASLPSRPKQPAPAPVVPEVDTGDENFTADDRAGDLGQAVARAREAGIFSMADFLRALDEGKRDAEASIQRYAAMAGDTAVWAAEAAKPVASSLPLELSGTGRQGGGLASDVVDLDIRLIAARTGSGKLQIGSPARAAREKFVARTPAPAPAARANVAWTASVGRDLIRGIVQRHRPEVRRCFRDGVERDPQLRGGVEVAFTITRDGSVRTPKIAQSDLQDREVEACITATVQRWQFPTFVASGGDVDVRLPFRHGAA